MYVIPAINCKDFSCVDEKARLLASFIEEWHMVHIDIADGLFAPRTWSNAGEWAHIHPPFSPEVHLMVERPEDYLGSWISAGVRRCVVHAEVITKDSLREMNDLCERSGVELMLSSNPDTSIEDMEPLVPLFTSFQVLAVAPGPSGQKFDDAVLEKIRFLREEAPDATIEVDGGMDPATARIVKAAGADAIVSEHFIFGGGDPRAAYEALKAI